MFNFQLKGVFILYFIIFGSFFLVMIIYRLFLVFFLKRFLNIEEISSYECGFDCISLTRLVFSYRFFLISILFVIFDVEISLIVPFPFYIINDFGIIVFFLFVFILIVGLIYEFYYGSLDWLRVDMNYN